MSINAAREGGGRLFPDMTRGKWKQKLSENFTKRFTYDRRRRGAYFKEVDFHSFRYDFNTMLVRKGVPERQRSYLMRHEAETITDKVYFGGFVPSELHEMLNRMQIDISGIRPASPDTGMREGPRLVSVS